MSATKISTPDAQRVLIETFDYRSEFSCDDFCDWVSQALNVSLIQSELTDGYSPRHFEFEGQKFVIGWDDEHGCFIEGKPTQRTTLDRVQSILAREG